jgi:CubicO group peptidase (beta-lactamase class C family)
MKHRRWFLALVAVAAAGMPAAAQFSEASDLPVWSRRLAAETREDRFSGAVLFAKLQGGAPQVLLRSGYGMANREKGIPNTVDTRFRIGSMNKMFTATAILQLVQAGKIRLTDPVGKYIPDYPNKAIATKVTIHELLTHTGGTGDIFGPEFDRRAHTITTHDDWITLYGKRDPLFEPGAQFSYSNYGMVLLGVVIERVSGKSYYDFVEENVYRPAGMTQSGHFSKDIPVSFRALGYTQSPGTSIWRQTSDDGNCGMAAGGGYSTVGDLLRFASALVSNKLLSAEYSRLLITRKVHVEHDFWYAYGFADMREDGRGYVGHTGGAPGMSSDFRIYMNTGYVMVVLSNFDPPVATYISNFLDARMLRW